MAFLYALEYLLIACLVAVIVFFVLRTVLRALIDDPAVQTKIDRLLYAIGAVALLIYFLILMLPIIGEHRYLP